ncbi:MAG: hypothetical protein ACOX6P_06445 [Candidatus Merdivicinus sp.]|jgi:hypothetical protein
MKCSRCHHETIGEVPYCTHCGKDIMPELDFRSIRNFWGRFGPFCMAVLLFGVGFYYLIREIYYLR